MVIESIDMIFGAFGGLTISELGMSIACGSIGFGGNIALIQIS